MLAPGAIAVVAGHFMLAPGGRNRCKVYSDYIFWSSLILTSDNLRKPSGQRV